MTNSFLFFKSIVELYDINHVSENVINFAILNRLNKKNQIIKNYSDPIVISLLKRIKDNKALSKEMKQTIDEILSGEIWNNLAFLKSRYMEKAA